MSERSLHHLVGLKGLTLEGSSWIGTPDYVREGSSDSQRNEFDYFANYAYSDVDGVIVHRAKVYDRDEAFKTPRFQLKVYWA
jgi:hypothetical protein